MTQKDILQKCKLHYYAKTGGWWATFYVQGRKGKYTAHREFGRAYRPSDEVVMRFARQHFDVGEGVTVTEF